MTSDARHDLLASPNHVGGGVEHVFEQRTIADREKRFRATVRRRSHAGLAAGREHDTVYVDSTTDAQ